MDWILVYFSHLHVGPPQTLGHLTFPTERVKTVQGLNTAGRARPRSQHPSLVILLLLGREASGWGLSSSQSLRFDSIVV